ncbi:MAG: alcohol dehydrogenase catalytic domain-containing protein [Planctomycetaceae bacterium]|nr:alcohol dehydrogenase catalytic domain-containing protein [Planctomycetaceae bacterium]
MQAYVLTAQGLRFDPDYPNPHLRDGEVPVRVLTAGICETDLQLIKGYMGFQGVLGHEFVGIAEDGPYAGKRVVGEINCSCHRCDYCNAGLANHCPHRSVLGILDHDGVFAETVNVPQANLHLVPDNVSDDEAVFTEPLAAAFQIPAQLDLSKFHSAIVLGDGRLGNLCAQVITQAGCDVTVIGKHAEKLRVIDELGIPTAPLSSVELERFADLVVDCTGSPTGLTTAYQLVRPRGTIVLKTTVAGDAGPTLAPVVIDEITVIGSRCGPFDTALKALESNSIHVTPLISARFALQEIERALTAARTAPNLKVLLDVSS